MFDLAEQDDILGKQNSSSLLPCSKCKVTKEHLQNHGDREHSIENCQQYTQPKNYSYYETALKDVTTHVTYKQRLERPFGDETGVVQTMENRRKEASKFGNVISANLLKFDSVDDMVDPLLHLFMGLTNDNLNAIRKDCQYLDRSDSKKSMDEIETRIKRLFQMLSKIQYDQNDYIERMDELKFIRDKIFPLIVKNKLKDAQKLAHKNYKVKFTDAHAKQVRKVCSSNCLLFPVDLAKGFESTIKCTNNCQPHIICEGLSNFSEVVKNKEMQYTCNSCNQYSPEDIRKQFSLEITKLDTHQGKLFTDANSVLISIASEKTQQEKQMGPRLRQFYRGLQELNTEQQSYHGGALNGKDCEKVLMDAESAKTSVKDSIILICIADALPGRAKNYLELFQILANVWRALRQPPAGTGMVPGDGLFDDEDVANITSYCTSWGKRLPLLFPERSITRKGHVLSFHIPEYIRKYRSFHLYYKLEQQGESLHATMNRLMRRFLPISPTEERMWKIIEEFERMNGIDSETIKPNKNSSKTPFLAKLTAAQLLTIGATTLTVLATI